MRRGENVRASLRLTVVKVGQEIHCKHLVLFGLLGGLRRTVFIALVKRCNALLGGFADFGGKGFVVQDSGVKFAHSHNFFAFLVCWVFLPYHIFIISWVQSVVKCFFHFLFDSERDFLLASFSISFPLVRSYYTSALWKSQ